MKENKNMTQQTIQEYWINWNDYLGSIWAEILGKIKLPNDGIVIELAPGKENKIGTGLAKRGFRGTLYIIEPDRVALNKITEIYKKEMPLVTLIQIPYKLNEALEFLPIKVDAILANHALDDMIIGKFIGNRFEKYFEELFNTPEVKTKQFWEMLDKKPKETKNIQNEILLEFMQLFEKTNPNFAILSQYESWFFKSHNMISPDKLAFEILSRLRQLFLQAEREDIIQSSDIIQDKNRWIVFETPNECNLIMTNEKDLKRRSY